MNDILQTIALSFKEHCQDYRVNVDDNKVIINNHIADFRSKFDIDGNRMSVNLFTTCCIHDDNITQILENVSTSINNYEIKHYHAEILEPGNIIEISII
jgi:hypothetical protein